MISYGHRGLVGRLGSPLQYLHTSNKETLSELRGTVMVRIRIHRIRESECVRKWGLQFLERAGGT